ncbi:hypothetical protein [Segatella bryantii]|uniref:hypothetical protein n=1 Tax=Segatella bryantii TaxID=77095 RepID=UPI0024310D32|nr:hypothetical protein [Segatella bryantii]
MKITKYIYSLLAVVMMAFMTGCSPDEYALGEKDLSSDDLVEGIAYTITHDSNNPNIIYLKSLLPSNYAVTFDTPQGRFQANSATLKIPFNGEYQARIGVTTRGGFLWGPYADFTVEDFCSEFVDNPLWTYISGGVGKSKTWKLDIDANALTRHSDLWAGPLGFWGVDDDWSTCFLGQTASAGDHWNWTPDIAGNGWVMTAMDYGYMTFDLIGGAHVTVHNNETGEEWRGTYMLDTDNHTITLSDAELLHNSGHDGVVTNWSKSLKLMGLDDDRLQIAALRDNSSEGPCLLCYNFCSQDYWDNWKPVVDETPVTPTLMEGWRSLIQNPTNREITFKLAEDGDEDGFAFGYCNLDGSVKDATLSANDGIEDATLVLYYGGTDATNTYTYTAPDGSAITGTYTLDDNGIFTFSNGLGNTSLGANYNMSTNADNTLRIMSVTKDDYTGSLKSVWLGKQCIDDQGNLFQYQGYHWKAQTAGAAVKKYKGVLNYFSTGFAVTLSSSDVFITGDGDYTFTINGANSEPYGIYLDIAKLYADNNNCDVIIKSIKVDGNEISFDDATIDRGTADGDHSTVRRYIVNPWGKTADEASKFSFTSSIEVTVHVTYDTGENKMEPTEAGAKRN